MRHYRWYRGHWHEVKPVPQGVRPQDLKKKVDLGTPADDIQFIPVPFEPEVKDTIVFLRGNFNLW